MSTSDDGFKTGAVRSTFFFLPQQSLGNLRISTSISQNENVQHSNLNQTDVEIILV
jgi:hypothetical protein